MQTDSPHATQFPTTPPLSTTPIHVLIADDDPDIRLLLEELLQDEGYVVVSTANGHELVQMAQQIVPDLVLVDLMMPLMDGYEAVRQLRHDTRTSHIPMLILTAQTQTHDVVVGFASGADDYITKPFDPSVLLARIQSHLRRAAQRPVHNPLTGLPGNALLAEEMRYRLERRAPLALLYVDLDNFKVFNDIYGFARGDEAILLLAHLVQHAVTLHGGSDTFIGHIGGDDFALLANPDHIDVICKTLLTTFDQAIAQLYHPADLKRGYLSGADRHGMLRRFALMTLSIGVTTTQRRTFASVAELSRVAAEMKQYAKTQPGSSYSVDRRAGQQPVPIEQAGKRRRSVQILSDDASLRMVLRAALYDGGYTVHEASSVDACASAGPPDAPFVVLAEARLGPALWHRCRMHAESSALPPIIILAATDAEVAEAASASAAAVLRQPLPVDDVVACIRQFSALTWLHTGQSAS